MARTFFTTLLSMIALAVLVLAIGMDRDANANASTGLDALAAMTAPSTVSVSE